MTRTAPLLTLLAVGVLGGALFVANTVGVPEATTASLNASTAASDAAGDTSGDVADDTAKTVISLSDLPVAGAEPPPPGDDANPPARVELDLSKIPVGGAPAEAPPAPPVVDPPAAPAPPPADVQADAADVDDLDLAYAGKTADQKLTVAIAMKDGKVEAYVCDGRKIESWMRGAIEGGKLNLQDKTGAATLTGDVTADHVKGSFSVGGKKFSYSAAEVTVDDAVANGRADVRDVAGRVGLVTP